MSSLSKGNTISTLQSSHEITKRESIPGKQDLPSLTALLNHWSTLLQGQKSNDFYRFSLFLDMVILNFFFHSRSYTCSLKAIWKAEKKKNSTGALTVCYKHY